MDIDVLIENVLELLTNTVNMTSKFYDIFLNPEPMDVTLDQYNDQNRLVQVTIPNRAKDRAVAKYGEGSPEGVVEASIGTIYIDISSSYVYFKVNGSGTDGWVLVLDENGITAIMEAYLEENGYLKKTDRASTTDFGVIKYDGTTLKENDYSQLSVSGILDQAGVLRKIWIGTQEEYNNLGEDIDSNTFYVTI